MLHHQVAAATTDGPGTGTEGGMREGLPPSLMEVRSDLPHISSDGRLTEETSRRQGPAARPIRMLPPADGLTKRKS